MNEKKKTWQDKDIEAALGNLLRWGVIFSSIIVFTGGILYLWRHGSMQPDYHNFHGAQEPFHSTAEVIAGLLGGKGQAIIQTGVIFLIATPIMRIVFAIFGFAKEKDKLYIFIALLVLAIIMTSLALGVKG